MESLPLIDVAPLLHGDAADRAAVAARLGAACREIGFFAVRGHGVPAPLRRDAFAAAAEVFTLPAAAKQSLAIGRHGPNHGYVALGAEALDETTAPDLKEAFNVVWSAQPAPDAAWPPLPGWRPRVQAWFDAMLALGTQLHRGLALDLGLPAHWFDDKLDHPQATLRLLRYPAAGAAATQAAARPGAGVHTDYGNLTLLATDAVGGLQVRRRDGSWIDVPHLPDALVCNIGDCLMRWTNDVYVSTPHRVLPPAQERYSIAFFLDPNADALVSALPGCVPPGQAPRHAPVTAGEYLRQRFAATYAKG